MSVFPSAVKNSAGRVFHLSKEIGRGGEGAIYETKEQNDIALKLYLPNKAQSRRDKVSAMVSAQWYKTNSFVAFPMDVLFSPGGAFAGFAMKKVGGHKPVHMLYSPASRKLEFHKANYPFLIRSALNISRAVASVHNIGCVIGDVNHSGFLVSEKATSILIDSDSFQIIAGNNSFLCQVGTPEYTPPELQSSRFERTRRTPNHDNFGLAVLVFQLLFMGRHPFSGKFLGSGEMPLERAISEYRFVYSMQTATNMERPPGAPLLSDFPPYIAQAFESAFSRAGLHSRPSALDWISFLEKLEGELQQCTADANHHHVKGRPCPWCRMEQANPGFVAFTSSQPTTYIPITINVAQVSAIINAIRDPGPPPNLQTVISNPTNINAAVPTGALISKLKVRAFGGIAASATGAVLIFFGGGAVFPGVLFLCAGLFCNVAVPPELKKIREAKSQAKTSWRTVQDAWAQQPGNKKYLEIKMETNDLIRTLADLPNEEKREIQILEQKKKEAQLNRHLDRFLIAHARIKKIGSGRKTVLASFGIETAADIDQRKISSIQGFGPSLVAELMAWRQTQANKFLFNPNEPINPGDLSALKGRIASRKGDLDNKIRTSAISLQQASNFSLEQRRKIAASANQAYVALKQTELNEAAVEGPLHKASKFISLCCAVLAAVGLVQSGEPRKRTADPTPSVVVATKPVTPAPAQPKTSAPKTESAPLGRPNIPVPTPQPQPIPGMPSASADAKQSGTQSAPSPPAQEIPAVPKSEAQSPQLPPAQEIPNVPGRVIEPSSGGDLARLDVSRSEDAIRVQQRLSALGYLSGSADGKWGPKSKAALVEFKSRANLPQTDFWDDSTQRALFSDNVAPYSNGPFSSSLSFVGGWTIENGQCGDPGEAPPLRITARRAETEGGACDFKSVQPDGQNAWKVSAVCSSNGKSWQANVRLTVKGSQLRWVSERPEAIYYRCQTSP